MTENAERQTAGKKLNSFIETRKKILVVTLIVLLCCIVALIACTLVVNKNKLSGLTALDSISYALTDGSAGLDESELNARRASALESLAALTSKGGIVGARANMLTAEIFYQQEKYADAAAAWKASAEKSPKSYIAPIAYYNLGVCYEQRGQNDDAADSYKKAADNKDYVLGTHAAFSYGRVLELSGKYAEAFEAYSQLYGKAPDDSWAKLAKTRMIALQIEGKAD